LSELTEAVAVRARGARTGVWLSGGLDSSVVAALAARETEGAVKTFTVGFSDVGAANELEAARTFARWLGADHHELELRLDDDTVSLEEFVWRLDEPTAELSALGLFELAVLAAPEIDTALSGQGADGILGGLGDHRTAAIAARLDWMPQTAKNLAASIFSRASGRARRGTRVLAASDPVARFLVQTTGQLPEAERVRLVRGPLAAVGGRAARMVVEERLAGLRGHPTATYIYVDEQLAAVDSVLHYNDRASQAGPVDVLFPFLDHHMVEFAATIPIDLKVRGMEGKRMLRRIAPLLVPQWVLERAKVGFFNAAIPDWTRERLRDAAPRYLLDPSAATADFLDRTEVERLVRAHQAGSDDHAALVFALLLLEVWLASALPRALALAPTDGPSLAA
jgi:asparagine synthase (glutamine-hydrolysing)